MSLRADIRLRRGGFTLDARFDAPRGEPLALIGPNGSGKSTICAALSGIIRIDSGSIELCGRTLDDGRRRCPPQGRGVGVVFQDRLLFPTMTVLDNIAFGLRAAGRRRDEAQRLAGKWLDRFGLTALARRRPGVLSGGEAQRVAIARALAIEPELLILDEPLAALDRASKPGVRLLIAETLRQFEGVALVITHDPIEAMSLAGRVAVIESGAIVQSGTIESVRRTPRSAFAAAFVGINLFRGELSLAGEKPAVLGARRVGGLEGEAAGSWSIRVAAPDLPDRSAVFAALHPRSVILSHERPASSARNAHRCEVVSIDPIEGALRVSLAGPAELSAEITEEARAELGLAVGSSVWASFKATEVAVYPG
ncbi:MAG: ABC transporter ATP-binding protein [Phycisphaeraceae bacterium]|nr:ABC transporter ATP-binding protein [Phycisphaeraceae bacterium]